MPKVSLTDAAVHRYKAAPGAQQCIDDAVIRRSTWVASRKTRRLVPGSSCGCWRTAEGKITGSIQGARMRPRPKAS
jgi:hypothetical protein